MIGIYRIRNLVNDKCYYGSSKKIEDRWKKHINDLQNNKHYNTILQRAWNKYGSGSFVFEVVELCEEHNLFNCEQKYLDKNPAYNIGIHASGGDNITKNPNKDRIIRNITNGIKDRYSKMTDEDKAIAFGKPLDKNPNWRGGISISHCQTCGKRISQNAKYCREHIVFDRSKENNAFYGKHHSREAKKKMSEKRIGKKPTNMTPITIDNITYESLAEASRQTGIPCPTILWRVRSKNKKYENYQSHPSIKAPLNN